MGTFIRFIFTYIFYPILIIGIFVFLINIIVSIIANSKDSNQFRKIVAAILPIMCLVFLTVLTNQSQDTIQALFLKVNNFYGFFIGVTFGIIILEACKKISESDKEIGSTLLILFISSVDVFILYSIMQSALSSLNYFLFGMVLGGCIDIILKGHSDIYITKIDWHIEK